MVLLESVDTPVPRIQKACFRSLPGVPRRVPQHCQTRPLVGRSESSHSGRLSATVGIPSTPHPSGLVQPRSMLLIAARLSPAEYWPSELGRFTGITLGHESTHP